MNSSVTIKGLAELRDKLLALGPEVGAKVLRTAAREAMKPVLAEAQRLAPRDTGALHDAIVLVAKMPKSALTLTRVGLKIRALKRTFNVPTKAESEAISARARWHFAEFGTAHTKAHPFLRPALETHKDAVISSLKAEIAKRVERVWKQRRKQAAIAKAVFGE